MKKLLFILVWHISFVPLIGQIQIEGVDIIPDPCNPGGKVILSISGGLPSYCYRLDGGTCQYSDQTTFTFEPISVGTHQLSVSDASDSVSIDIVMVGIYEPPTVTCSIDGCSVSAVVSEGKTPLRYAISRNGGAFSPYQNSRNFDKITGDFCIEVLDDCGNTSECCGYIQPDNINFKIECCEDASIPDNKFCVQLMDLNDVLPTNQSFDVGGTGPYSFSAYRGNQIVTSQDGNFVLDADCPVWSFEVEDACGNKASQEFSCISAEPTCYNCVDGTISFQSIQTAGPNNFFILSDTGWVANPNGVNSPNFDNLSSINSHNGYVFSISDNCNQESDSIFIDCFSSEALYNCALGRANIKPITPFYPVDIVCTTCVPAQSISLQQEGNAFFNFGVGTNSFTLTNACDDIINITCKDTLPTLTLRKSCNSLEAIYKSGYVCEGFEPTYETITSSVTYNLYLKSNPGQLLASNQSGAFFDLTPGEVYEIEAIHPICGSTTKAILLFNENSHNLAFDLTPSSILDGTLCKKSYTLKAHLDEKTIIDPIYSLTGGPFKFDTIDEFTELLPGAWVLSTSNYCDSIIINLPEWDTNLSAELPECLDDPCVLISGLRKASQWEDWGSNLGLPVKGKIDFYTLNCTDILDPTCKKNVSGKFCNFPYDSTHYVYLYPRLGKCAVDTIDFNISIDDFEKIDSLYIPPGITCNVQDAATIQIEIYGGAQPLSADIIDTQTNQVVASIDDSDGDYKITASNLYSQNSYKVKVSDDCGDIREEPFEIFSLPNIKIDYEFLCDGRVQLSTPDIQSANFVWKDETGSIISSGVGMSKIVLNAPSIVTTFTVEISISQCTGHSTSIDLPVFYYPEITLPNSDTLLCQTDSMILLPQAGFGNYEYKWNTGEDSINLVVDSIGVYEIIATNEFNCPDTATISVGISKPFNTQIMIVDNICAGDVLGAIDLEVLGGVSPYSFLWDGGETTSFLENLPAGEYDVEIIDSLQCSEIQHITISEPSFFSIQIPNSSDLILGEEINISAIINGNPVDPVEWEWVPANQVKCPLCPSTIIQPLTSSYYTLTGTDANGCVSSSSIQLTVDESCTAIIPNAFSFSADDYNSFVRLFAAPCVEEVLDFTLYDRWGNLITVRNNFQPQNEEVLWDGRFQNKRASTGVYFWILNCKLVNGDSKIWTGDISVLD